ncbi:response regulator [Endozoicomonas ascidiicola]|uniref:response regulator n=1 Tax=Endozoicomonas ascidiicola TaxID=1698521 RepID=UPI00155F5A19|nr:response regulator [Endozoicomonas ascidiicola]
MNFRDRLSYKQVRYTVTVAFILGLVFGSLEVTHDYLTQDNSIDASIQAYLDVSMAPASRIAYNLDEELASELVSGLTESPLILQATIATPEQYLLGDATRPVDTVEQVDDSQLVEYLFGTTRVYQQRLSVPYDREEDLGNLTIVADTRASAQAFIDRSVLTLTFGIARTLLLALALHFMLYIMLTKPLQRLTQHVQRVRAGSTRQSMSIPRSHQHDEIGQLSQSFNDFQEDIKQQLYRRSLAESELRVHTQELENRIAERTQELQKNNDALFKANKALDSARQAALQSARIRGDQLSSLSHEIRTPLNGILGMLELAINDELSPDQHSRLELAHQSGARLVKLLNNMLDLARLESGKTVVDQVPFNLKKVLEESVMVMGQKAHMKGIPLTCQIDPALPATLMGDPIRITQVVNNLLGNAIKFTHSGMISLSLVSELLEDSKERIAIHVRDTGIGISKDAQQAIFSPFTQANNDIYQHYGGSGMGLALTKEIIKAMNGTIEVKSLEGSGSTFTVKLTLGAIVAKTSDTSTTSVVQNFEPTEQLFYQKKKILVVEDNAINRLVTEGMLEQLGHEVTLAHNGEDCISACISDTFDLILMDCNMPVMDGYTATQQLRERSETRDIPIVALTANALNEHQEQCKQAGMDDYLSKPFNKKALSKVISEWL